MIKSFRHKGLEAFFRSGSRKGIQPHHASKLQVLLAALDNAAGPEGMNAPNWRLHNWAATWPDIGPSGSTATGG